MFNVCFSHEHEYVVLTDNTVYSTYKVQILHNYFEILVNMSKFNEVNY